MPFPFEANGQTHSFDSTATRRLLWVLLDVLGIQHSRI